jgi:hypothetical protein
MTVSLETIKTWIQAGLYVKIFVKNGRYMVTVGGME